MGCKRNLMQTIFIIGILKLVMQKKMISFLFAKRI